MNSASQSESVRAAAVLAEADRLTRQGRRLASPTWFALLCVATTVLAAVPFALLVGDGVGQPVYWTVAGTVSAAACAWFYQTRDARVPERVGLPVLGIGAAMLIGSVAVVWIGSGDLLLVPWAVLSAGLGLLALAWRSWAAGVVCAAGLLTLAVVGPADFDRAEIVLALVIGITAALAVFVELVRESAESRR